MAAGDAISHIESVTATTGIMAIQPGSGVEWCIHNIAVGEACTLCLTDGTNDVEIDTMTAPGGWINQVWFLTNTCYLRVKNTSASAAYFGYTGVVTK